MDEMPTKIRASSQSFCPHSEFGAAKLMSARGGYEVQPAAAAPPGTKKLARMMAKAGHMNQYDIMFNFGNAMSLAPIISGIVKLPKAPVSSGMMTKKIITVACILKNMLYDSGGIR